MVLNLYEKLKNQGYSDEVVDFLLEKAEAYDEAECINEIDRKAIHKYVSLPRAWKCNDKIIGFKPLDTLMYYVGLEDKKELILKLDDLYVYRVYDGDEDRFQVIEE